MATTDPFKNQPNARSNITPNLKWLKWTFIGIAVLIIYLMLPINLIPLTIVPAGNVGVEDLFGSVYDEVFQPGLHFVNPLALVHKMSVQTL